MNTSIKYQTNLYSGIKYIESSVNVQFNSHDVTERNAKIQYHLKTRIYSDTFAFPSLDTLKELLMSNNHNNIEEIRKLILNVKYHNLAQLYYNGQDNINYIREASNTLYLYTRPFTEYLKSCGFNQTQLDKLTPSVKYDGTLVNTSNYGLKLICVYIDINSKIKFHVIDFINKRITDVTTDIPLKPNVRYCSLSYENYYDNISSMIVVHEYNPNDNIITSHKFVLNDVLTMTGGVENVISHVEDIVNECEFNPDTVTSNVIIRGSYYDPISGKFVQLFIDNVRDSYYMDYNNTPNDTITSEYFREFGNHIGNNPDDNGITDGNSEDVDPYNPDNFVPVYPDWIASGNPYLNNDGTIPPEDAPADE